MSFIDPEVRGRNNHCVCKKGKSRPGQEKQVDGSDHSVRPAFFAYVFPLD